MITELTKEQEARFPEYVEKWLKIGLCTDRVDRSMAEWISDYYYYEIAGKRGAKISVIIMPSPLSAWIAVCMLSQVESQVWSQVRSQVRSQVWSQVESQVESQVKSQVWSQVGSQVWSQVESQVKSQVGSQVRSQVWSQVESQVESQVWSQVWSQVESQVKSQVWSFTYPWLDGHFMSPYFAFYNFINEVLGIKFNVQEKYNWYQKTSEVGLIYPLDNVCIISDRPELIKMKNGRLHSDDSPAIRYTDGLSMYSLNGICMKPEYVLTPADKLELNTILKEPNVDMRRELIRKVGVLRLKSYGKSMDKQGNYEVIDMEPVLHNGYDPFLLMLNPSVPDTWHLECVGRECKTVEQALNYRKPKSIKNIPVSPDGEDWYQQGDVVVYPQNALMLKPYPAILT